MPSTDPPLPTFPFLRGRRISRRILIFDFWDLNLGDVGDEVVRYLLGRFHFALSIHPARACEATPPPPSFLGGTLLAVVMAASVFFSNPIMRSWGTHAAAAAAGRGMAPSGVQDRLLSPRSASRCSDDGDGGAASWWIPRRRGSPAYRLVLCLGICAATSLLFMLLSFALLPRTAGGRKPKPRDLQTTPRVGFDPGRIVRDLACAGREIDLLVILDSRGADAAWRDMIRVEYARSAAAAGVRLAPLFLVRPGLAPATRAESDEHADLVYVRPSRCVRAFHALHLGAALNASFTLRAEEATAVNVDLLWKRLERIERGTRDDALFYVLDGGTNASDVLPPMLPVPNIAPLSSFGWQGQGPRGFAYVASRGAVARLGEARPAALCARDAATRPVAELSEREAISRWLDSVGLEASLASHEGARVAHARALAISNRAHAAQHRRWYARRLHRRRWGLWPPRSFASRLHPERGDPAFLSEAAIGRMVDFQIRDTLTKDFGRFVASVCDLVSTPTRFLASCEAHSINAPNHSLCCSFCVSISAHTFRLIVLFE